MNEWNDLWYDLTLILITTSEIVLIMRWESEEAVKNTKSFAFDVFELFKWLKKRCVCVPGMLFKILFYIKDITI